MAKKRPFAEEFKDKLRQQVEGLFGIWHIAAPGNRHEFNVMVQTPGRDGGIETTKVLSIPATPDQARYFSVEPHVVTGIEWSAMGMAGRIKFCAETHLPSSAAHSDDLSKVLPQDVRDYLQFWQRQMNSGECYFAPHEIGARANKLLEAGLILAPRVPRADWRGDPVPTRDRVPPGQPGSYRYVEAVMGPGYAKWIAAFSV